MKNDHTRFIKFLSLLQGTSKAKAHLFGVTNASISHWQSGLHKADLKRVELLARVFDVPASIFWELTPLNVFDDHLASSNHLPVSEALKRINPRLLYIHADLDTRSQDRLSKFVGNFWLYRRSIKDPLHKVAKSAFLIYQDKDGNFKFIEIRQHFSTQNNPLPAMRMEGEVCITTKGELIFSGFTLSGQEKKPKYMISNSYTEDHDFFHVLLTAPPLRNDKAFSCTCVILRNDDIDFNSMAVNAKIIDLNQAEKELATFGKHLPDTDAFVVLDV